MSKKVLNVNILEEVRKNKEEYKIIYKDKATKIVIMNLKNGLPNEKHTDRTQTFYIVSGKGKIVYGKTLKNRKSIILKKGVLITIPKGTYHQLFTTSKQPLKLYSIYSIF